MDLYLGLFGFACLVIGVMLLTIGTKTSAQRTAGYVFIAIGVISIFGRIATAAIYK